MRSVKFWGWILGVAGLVIGVAEIRAATEVITLIEVIYEINENGRTETTFEVKLENLVTEKYAKSFNLRLTESEPKNVKAWEGNNELKVITKDVGEGVAIEVIFTDAVVGKGKVRNFKMVMEDDSYVERLGEVWEINLPQIKGVDDFEEVNVELKVPQSLGELAYISPEPTGRIETNVREIFYYTKENILDGGISLAFGEFQVYSFSLTYHLENPVKEKQKMEVAIPPDTAWQRVIYENISPEPQNVITDQDGNWIAEYELKGRERMDILVRGNVQIFTSPRSLTKVEGKTLELNKKESEYWQVNDEEIKKLASELGGVEEIYDFVIERLSYDYERVKPNIKRKGALEALRNPSEAICMEFTDLFIALCRAQGIAAREVNGYAYSENTKLQPLSLVADVIHAWPEYWDEEKNVWVGVDPTWADTTGGEDFFRKLDLRHFAFVIHGVNAEKPYSPGSYKLGANPQKDVYVSFSQLPEIRKATTEVEIRRKPQWLGGKQEYEVLIKNTGPTAVYQQKAAVQFDGIISREWTIEEIPPYGWRKEKLEVKGGILGWKLPEVIEVDLQGEEKVTIDTEKDRLIMMELTVAAMLLVATAAVVIKKARISK